jgi:mannose-6-phosphate isomerase-like protein (cupin superfamily)
MRKLSVLFVALLCSTAVAQTAAYSTDQLLQMRLDANTLLAFRDRDGKGEQHQQLGDVFFVLQGTATLVTGGTISNPATTAPGEIRGASVQDGTRRKLQEGDVVHIPANTPHQMLLDSGSSITYFVVKIPQK